MAGLPPDGEYVIQQNGGIVTLSHAYGDPSLRDLVTFDPSDADDTAKAQGRIAALEELTDEQKSFAYFWSGYFYAHASRGAF